MKLAKQDLLAALRLRYDHYSAQAIFETALAKAGLDDLAEYDLAQVAAFRAALSRVGDRLANVDERLDMLTDVVGGAAVVPAPVEKILEPGIHEIETPKPVETTITLAGIDVDDGDQVLVCGELPVLGMWDPERARAMTREGMYWLTKIVVPLGTDVPFKFLRKTADGTVVWEAGHNRQLLAKPRIEATWGA